MLNWTKSPIRVVSSLRKFNFSLFIKLFKLNHKDQFYIIPQQNPLINFERKDWKHQKPQIFIGSKFSLKCMKKCMKHENKWKRRGKRVLPALEDKNLWKFLRENDKSWLDLDRLKRESQKVFEKVWIVKNTWRKHVFKKLSKQFSIDRKIDSIDQKLNSINPKAIEHRSSQADSNQILIAIFDQSRNRFDRLKI